MVSISIRRCRGSSARVPDGYCNRCICNNGVSNCSSVPCSATDCTYGGYVYHDGWSVTASSGCSSSAQCTCVSGVVRCEEPPCACDTSLSTNRVYVSLDASNCDALTFACPEKSTKFFNGCGCGCEQSLNCPRAVGCSSSDSTGDAGNYNDTHDADTGNSAVTICPVTNRYSNCPLSP